MRESRILLQNSFNVDFQRPGNASSKESWLAWNCVFLGNINSEDSWLPRKCNFSGIVRGSSQIYWLPVKCDFLGCDSQISMKTLINNQLKHWRQRFEGYFHLVYFVLRWTFMTYPLKLALYTMYITVRHKRCIDMMARTGIRYREHVTWYYVSLLLPCAASKTSEKSFPNMKLCFSIIIDHRYSSIMAYKFPLFLHWSFCRLRLDSHLVRQLGLD